MLDNQNNPEESNENRQLTPEELAYLEQLYYKDMGFFEKHSAKLKNGWAIRKAIKLILVLKSQIQNGLQLKSKEIKSS